MSFNFIKDKHKKVHFIGIGGVSMSGLAAVLLNKGYKVSGSDAKQSAVIDKLREAGAEIYIGHHAENLKNVDLVVYTVAISNDNPEFVYAKENNIPLMTRAEFLGHIMLGHKYNVAISGTHGKTTCTSMISHIALSADLDPTILVGGDLDAIHGNYRIGNSEYFITEACEYKESFLKFFPYIGVILNIDADHLDYYKDIDAIEEAFRKFAALIPEDGYLVGNADDERVCRIMKESKCNTISFGLDNDNADITAKNISFNEKACASFDVYRNGVKLFSLSLNTPGKHNVLNALAAISVGLIFSVKSESIVNGLFDFKGARKRFELKGEKNGITVVDDYAHHPTEVKACLSTAKNTHHKKIFCVFQPHTFTRTKALFKEFTEAFSDADVLVLLDIYAAREKDTGLVSSDQLGDAIRAKGMTCVNAHSFEEACKYVKDNAKSGDLVLTVGAGEAVKVGEMFLK